MLCTLCVCKSMYCKMLLRYRLYVQCTEHSKLICHKVLFVSLSMHVVECIPLLPQITSGAWSCLVASGGKSIKSLLIYGQIFFMQNSV